MRTTRYIAFSIFLGCAFMLNARNYAKNEEIFVNVNQSDGIGNWAKDGAKIYLYFFDDSGKNKWLELKQANGYIYRGVIPEAWSFPKVIVIRGTSASWEGKWNQSENIDIPADWNCIDNFADASHRWKMYTPTVAAIGKVADIKSSGVTEEVFHVCTDAAEDPFSLKVKLNSAKTAYVYENVNGHSWFQSTNGSTWTSIDHYAGKVRDNENNKDTLVQLPTLMPETLYYYLYSSIPAGRRLIQIIPDVTCDLDCSITSFETAISAVNADNNTFTLDGMVAFGKPNGKLVIECDDLSGTVKSVTIDDPKSPQSFSLHGVTAALESGKTYEAKAYFQGDETNCSKTIIINVPNAKEAVKEIPVDSLTGRTIVLVPQDADPDNDYVWIIAGVEHTKAEGQTQNCTIPAIGVDSTATYIYKEFNPAAGTMDDMMANGSYEEAEFDYGKYGSPSTISDYNYWGIHQQTDPDQDIHFYDTCSLKKSPDDPLANGFAVVRNANRFHASYAKVKAKEGDNLALFDAATGKEGGNKKAWYATTAKNNKLKLQAGTTYVLSFWAANINNYGEMDNAAQFKFRIEYNGKTWESEVLDLSKAEFRNNIWHQHSETFLATEDCNDVTISVVNLNTNVLNVGNDFALDDIQFHPISSISKVVKSHQQFTVTTHEPRVDAFTATTHDRPCNDTLFTIDMQVKYRNANDSLFIRDLDRDTIYGFVVPEKAIEEQGTFEVTIALPEALAGTVRHWEAYFKVMPENKQTAESGISTRLVCERQDTTICEGSTMTWKGGTFPQTPFIGTETFIVGRDTLVLTVLAMPTVQIEATAKLCDSDTEIRLPFTVVKGAPDVFTIRINNSDYTATVQGKEIVIARPAALAAGSYTATVFVGKSDNNCESTNTVSLRIDDSHYMYRKWEDVLFIDNSSKRFVAYQWFENGKELQGETLQYLYQPDGMPGTYFCRVTASDGATFYTCELPFNEVTRSRDVSNDKKQEQIIRQYRISPHVYVVQVQTGDQIETRKILTPYE